jgi:hypothetical protein
MARIRLNQEYRNKCGNRIKAHLFQEDTQEKRKYDELKAEQHDLNDKAWEVAKTIVRRHYTDYAVSVAQWLQDNFENVSTIAKDSCFHFHYLGKKEKTNYNNEVEIEENVPIEKHFDFKLNGDIDTDSNSSYRSDWEYAYALLRDEINAQENCNADILIEQDGKDNNPHKTKYTDNNNKFLELANELGIQITDAEIIRTNSTGLTIFNPKNLAERVKAMKNKHVSKEDKIKARLLYEQQQKEQNSLN